MTSAWQSPKDGADVTLNFRRNVDVVAEVMKITGGRGADSSIEALGTQATFARPCRCCGPGARCRAWGCIRGLSIPLAQFAAGLGDHTIRTALCPGGKERLPPDERDCRESPGSGRAGDAPAPAGRHRGGLRPVCPPARRGAEDRHQAVMAFGGRCRLPSRAGRHFPSAGGEGVKTLPPPCPKQASARRYQHISVKAAQLAPVGPGARVSAALMGAALVP